MKKEEVKEKTVKKGTTTKNKNTRKDSKPKKDVNKVVEKKIQVKEVLVEEVKETKKENTDNNTKRKSDIFLILGLVVVVVLGFVLMRDKNAGPTYELPLTLSGEAGLHQLTYAEYQEKVDNDEEFVVILERATCSHCVTYMPIAEKFASDNGVPMYYVDTDTFSESDWEGFEKSNSYLRKANGYWGTPTTMVLVGSETVEYIEGTSTAEELLALYNKYFDMGDKE